tara:strand:+ start:321 stop:1226 length:906 start_codon:yes stop_codon:yes gene_type:complete
MVIYYCEICNFSSKIKTHLSRHLKTKKHLTNEKNYEEDNVKNYIMDTQKIHKDTQKIQKDTQKIHKKDILEKKEKNEICNFCDKTFNTRKSMLRHIRIYCKKKKELDKMEKLENENSKIIEKQNKFIKSQTKQISKLLEKNGKQINTQNNNTQNNTNSNNTINNTIHINNYGEENLEMLTDEFKEKCVTRPFYAILEIIKKIHFNDDYPENKNMRLVNKRDNKIQVLDDGKWKYRYKDEAVKYAFDDSNERLEQFCVEKSPKFRKFIKICCEDIIKNVQECEPELMKELYKEMDLILLNGC